MTNNFNITYAGGRGGSLKLSRANFAASISAETSISARNVAAIAWTLSIGKNKSSIEHIVFKACVILKPIIGHSCHI